MKETLENYSLSKKVQSKKGALKKVGIVGGGTMGQEISILTSKAGLEVIIIDVSDERIKQILELIGGHLDAMINSWGMTTGDKKAILSRINCSTDYNELSDCDIVIECINTKKTISNLDIRKDVFRKIEEVVREDTVIASNASTVLIADLSVVLKNPMRSIGLHFLSPAFEVKIIEVNKCISTSEETTVTIEKFAKMIKKRIINVTASPGNISTRLIVPMINEACEMLMEGVSTVEEIDTTMMVGFGMQMGPFAMADKIGLDKLMKWMEGLYEEFGDKVYKTSPIIKRMVRANLVGKRAGEGFYKYNSDGQRINKTGSIRNLGRDEF